MTYSVMLFWLGYFGAAQAVWAADVTHITTLTFALFLLMSAIVGINTYRLDYENKEETEKTLEIGWFVSEFCTSLGLLGTVIGFILMMSTQLTAANASDPASMITMITHISMSMGTALYTTAVGIGCGMMLKIQCLNLQYAIEHVE